ncbi:GNAT family N-acetyltransferase [Aquimarina sp. I32.4]|uniref:GNAT family N-acetyltransferase n=1 Tax=Aquimarina sp. I32.4 TaxID=2053903 RepID=UPI000CDECE84|nr:GNAT family protein [Aquimarina sp. I32.4]
MKPAIKLRPLIAKDAQLIANLLNNKKVWDNLKDYIPYPYALKDAEEFIEFAKTKDPLQNLGITYNGAICGVISLILQTDIYRKNAEMGYWIGEQYWGKGIGTKAVELITEYGFKDLALERIEAGVFAYNRASMSILEKNGYTKEGICKNAIIKNGKILDEHIYAKLKYEQ